MDKGVRLRAVLDEDDWWLGWTTDRGIPTWVPMQVQEWIVTKWNLVVCWFKGHRIVGEIRGTLCSHCMHCMTETLGTGCRWCELDDKDLEELDD